MKYTLLFVYRGSPLDRMSIWGRSNFKNGFCIKENTQESIFPTDERIKEMCNERGIVCNLNVFIFKLYRTLL